MASQKRSRSSTQDDNPRAAKRSRHDDEEAAARDAGQIEYLHLENFMCHRNLEVELRAGVNVITGNNGSGKSAILAALQVALGSKAKSTNRGTSMKEVIKEGEESCRVTVYLSNGGEDAYEPDTYGSRIVVVRRLSRTSTSSYKIQDEDGHNVSSSVKDLRKILDHFNIHLDNPCTVMNQDVSRVFLANSTPSAKYHFFLEATQLQKMMDDFEESMKHKAVMHRVVEQKQAAIQDTKRELDRLKKEFDDASHLKDLDRQIRELDSELLWALVRDKEVYLKRFQENLDKLESVRDAHQARKEELDKQKAEHEKQVDDTKNELIEKSKEFKEQDEALNDERHSFANIKRESGMVQRSIDDWKTRIRHCIQRIETYKREIRSLEVEGNRDKSGELREREEKIERYTKMLDDSKKALEENREKQNAILDELNQAEEQVRSSSTSVHAVKSQIDRTKQKINQMGRQNQDPLAYYSPEMRSLFREIERNRHRFQKCPVGPIGMLVKVKDLKWAGTVELALKNSLSTFVVDNSRDRQVLMDVAKHCRARISAITQTFSDRVYSEEQLMRGGVPDPRFRTIFQLMDVDPNRARHTGIQYDRTAYATSMNALIDQSQIAQTILANNDDEAKRIMFARQTPAHAVMCYSMNGSKFQKRGNTEVMDPRKNVYSTLWAENFDAQIRELTAEMENQSREYHELHTELKKHEKEARRVKSAQNALREEERKLQRSVKHAEQNLDAINREPFPEQEDKNDEEIAFRQNLIVQEEDKKKELEESIEKFKEENSDMIVKMAEAEKRLKELDHRKTQIRTEVQAITAKLEAVKKNLGILVSSSYQMDRQLIVDERNITVVKAKIVEQEVEVRQSINIATNVCPTRLHPTTSTDDIKNKRKALNTTRTHEQQRFGGRNLAEIERAYTDFLRLYTHSRNAIDSAVHDLTTFKDSLTTRYNKWKDLREYYVNRTSEWFNKYLSQRGHSGRLEFDLDADELETVVSLASSGSNKSEVRDTKSLSGGERSFATTALLLSLWRVVESPFRCLDEFDVFMDAVTRKISFSVLIHEALKNKTRQLIIITPHNVSMLRGDVHVVRLRPPARDGMQQQTLDDFSA
eukprot:CAMPEP_0117445174 /NCGR_PEP_ID=MMETSP0759-20121206/5651_1 /TAXON_ID=63605 /ORGANISM="Percolomonas cosmopolitus, Strain WS" /LENGTH=1096 /DNA_ID=CAMNT_0005237325 /DNA_START=191 /DNA_END=3481 /DNA_ORIENTATION=+